MIIKISKYLFIIFYHKYNRVGCHIIFFYLNNSKNSCNQRQAATNAKLYLKHLNNIIFILYLKAYKCFRHMVCCG